MSRQSAIIVGAMLFLGAVALVRRVGSSAGYPHADVCAGPPLRTVEARLAAMVNGYAIVERYDCVDKRSTAAADSMRLAAMNAITTNPAPVDAALPAPEPISAQSLVDARHAFNTTVSHHVDVAIPLPQPPARLFVRADYSRTSGPALPAFVTPDPKDGRKHPAIIWLTGGDSNTLDDFWTPGPSSNDQSASAFRNAGVVMMFPTLRDGNGNPGTHEYFLGEVDDVLAAAERLAQLPYVDPAQIYLGGHSTGGTLALLAAESSSRFRAVFAFGPVAEIDRYPESLVPVSFSALDERERRLRSPRFWLAGIGTPTWLIEGRVRPSNVDDVEEMCASNGNPQVHCVIADGVDHVGVLARVNAVIAGRVAIASEIPFVLRDGEFSSARPAR